MFMKLLQIRVKIPLHLHYLHTQKKIANYRNIWQHLNVRGINKNKENKNKSNTK